jgi:hypothetical protein
MGLTAEPELFDRLGDVLIGSRVTLDGSKPALRVCRYCGCTEGILTGPKGPHHDGVRCANCTRHLGWLPPPRTDDFSVVE